MCVLCVCRSIVTLQLHGVQLALLGHDGEYLLLYGCRSQLHTHTHKHTETHTHTQLHASTEHQHQRAPLMFVCECESVCVCVCVTGHLDPAEHAGIEDVNAGVDLVGDEDLRLLHKALNSAAVPLKHHHAVFRGLLHPRYLHTHTHRTIVYNIQ